MATATYLQATITVQVIIDAVAKDAVTPFYSNGGNQSLLIDYCNRVHMQVMRYARFMWDLSAVKRFITIPGQTDYWLSTTGSAPAGSVDTALNLTDIHQIKEGTVYNRTNYRELNRVFEEPALVGLALPDVSARISVPTMWRESPDTPSILNIYPAPDNAGNTSYTPQPEPPYCTTVTSGALSARTYFVRTTFVDAAGNESTPNSTAAEIYVPANKLVKVISPTIAIPASATGISYSQWKVYIGTTLGAETVQNSATAINIGTNFTEDVTGITSTGAAWPTTNNLEELGGYIIEFRYWKQRIVLTAVGDILQVPDVYKDIIIAGVNEYLANWLVETEGQAYSALREEWKARYRNGLTEIIKDFNLFPKGADFIGPDRATTSRLDIY